MTGLDEVLQRGGDADDVLRSAVSALADEPGVAWVSIWLREDDGLILGPSSGTPDEQRRIRVPIAYRGDPVGELVVDGSIARKRLDSVAAELAPYVLLGWDTGGEAWEP